MIPSLMKVRPHQWPCKLHNCSRCHVWFCFKISSPVLGMWWRDSSLVLKRQTIQCLPDIHFLSLVENCFWSPTCTCTILSHFSPSIISERSISHCCFQTQTHLSPMKTFAIYLTYSTVNSKLIAEWAGTSCCRGSSRVFGADKWAKSSDFTNHFNSLNMWQSESLWNANWTIDSFNSGDNKTSLRSRYRVSKI